MGKSKDDKLRGKRTHGKGNTKNGRGKGATGGKGRAGSTKHKFNLFYKTFGHKVRLCAKERGKEINLSQLELLINDNKEIDLKKLGYSKILGKGNITKPVVIKNCKITKVAKEKIEAVGGKIE